MDYDYENDLQNACRLLSKLKGANLKKLLVNVVEPEFNVVYLQTSNGTFAIQGEVGGEYLGIHSTTSLPDITSQEGYLICRYEPFSVFEGRVILQARQIGTVWNGHGFELSFAGLLDKTMLIQSIYAGEKPKQFEDCLRLGIGNYSHSFFEQKR